MDRVALGQLTEGRYSRSARSLALVALIRGDWDGLFTDEDAERLYRAFTRSPIKRDIKIGRATHLMHLETMRWVLWRTSVGFRLGDDFAPLLLNQRAAKMVCVIFEGHPKPERFDDDLANAKRLKPLLESIDGFVDNERFESRARTGWLPSHST